ncbi:MAG TPA: hypothetical protein PLT25_11960 [Acidocella sp.]|nr:hypothetical protein [Acidocella sp.]
MRPVVKLVKATVESIDLVQQRMRETPYFTRNEVKSWFVEFDTGLCPINAGRAADALMANLNHRRLISKMASSEGWRWCAPLPAAAPPAEKSAEPVDAKPTFGQQMRAACEEQNVSFDGEFSWWPSIEFYIRRATEAVHYHNQRWWHDLHTGDRLDRNVGEMLMLIVSEIAEAMEGHRKGLMDDKLPHRPMLEVELADAVLRILDLAGGLKLDLAGAVLEKSKYNVTRVDHTAAARLALGGKAY